MYIEAIQVINHDQTFFFTSSIIVSFLVISTGIREAYRLAKLKGLTVRTSNRSSHYGQVPFLGGTVVYIACLIAITSFLVVFKGIIDTTKIEHLFLGSTIILLVGLYDDLIDIVPWKKLIFQLIVASLTVLLMDNFSINFFLLFGLEDLGPAMSFIFSIFLIVALINAFNFIDGIDGLCSGIAMTTFLFFGILAVLKSDYALALLNGSLLGTLTMIFYKNVFSRRKMFLGDSGSYLIGFLVGIQVILTLSGNFQDLESLDQGAPIIIMSLLSYPLVDSLRVIVLRILRGVSPFSADRNHIHHNLLDLGFSHILATAIILGFTILVVCLSILMKDVDINISFGFMLSFALIILNIPYFILKSREVKHVGEDLTT